MRRHVVCFFAGRTAFFLKTLLLQSALLVFIGCSKRVAPESPDAAMRVLFIGNSLTYYNDLPALVKEIGAQAGVEIAFKTLAFPDYGLEDHWNEGKAHKEIESGRYDVVVLQQGPSALPESQQILADYAGRFADLCRRYNAQPALYMVWPSKARSFDHDNVVHSYTRAAQKSDALLCPGGLAWQHAWRADPKTALYGPDHFHPSLTGSLLAAMTVYGAIKRTDQLGFIGLSKASWRKEVDEATFQVLKKAALQALRP